MTDAMSDLERQRHRKLASIRERGVDPYPAQAGRTHTTAEALSAFEAVGGTDEELTALDTPV